jgi:hypothetical protein
MESTRGLPGRNWSTGTGTSPAKGTGAADVRNTANTVKNNAKIPARQLIGFILLLLFNLISIASAEQVFVGWHPRFQETLVRLMRFVRVIVRQTP